MDTSVSPASTESSVCACKPAINNPRLVATRLCQPKYLIFPGYPLTTNRYKGRSERIRLKSVSSFTGSTNRSTEIVSARKPIDTQETEMTAKDLIKGTGCPTTFEGTLTDWQGNLRFPFAGNDWVQVSPTPVCTPQTAAHPVSGGVGR